MRIWIDPQKLIGFNLTPADVAAIAAQNAQVAGQHRRFAQPHPGNHRRHGGQGPAVTPKSSPTSCCGQPGWLHGAHRRCRAGRDRRQEYQFGTRLNGKPSTAFSVQLAPGANAWKPPPWCGRRWMSCRATSRPASIQDPLRHLAVRQSLDHQVVYTLVEAMVLVFAVMFLFLQNIRYTLIPTLVVPVALMGTFA
jgi:multidrug efflux pump